MELGEFDADGDEKHEAEVWFIASRYPSMWTMTMLPIIEGVAF